MRKLLNIASSLIILAMVAVALWFYFTTDKVAVPMHWNAVGDIDSYGKTWTILVLAGVGVLVYLFLLLNQKVVTLNVPFTVSDPERARPYVRMLTAWMTFLISLAFLYVVGAVAQLYVFHAWVVCVDVAALLVVSVYFTHRVRRAELGK